MATEIVDIGTDYLNFLQSNGTTSNTKLTCTAVGGLVLSREGGSVAITGVADPTASDGVATKSWVETQVSGTAWKSPVRVATTANITLSGTQTIDGVSVVADDRVLVKDQSTGSENGIYVVSAGGWSRATDFDAGSDKISGTAVLVREGTVSADYAFMCTTDGAAGAEPTVGTDALTFEAFVNTAGTLADSVVTNGKIADDAVTSAKIANDTIVNDDINSNAAIAFSKLASATAGQVLLGNGSNVVTATALTGHVQVDATGATTIQSGVVTSDMISDDTIVNGDIATGAAIAHSKLANSSAGNVMLANGSGVMAATNVTGHVQFDGTGATTIQSGVVTSDMIANDSIMDADINGSAAIAVSKLAASTISGVTLGGTLAALDDGDGVEFTSGSDYTGTTARTLKVTPAQTTITSVTNATLKVGKATNTDYVDFGTPDEVLTKIGDSTILRVTATKTYGEGGFQATSDERRKTAFTPLENAVQKIKGLRCVNFKWKQADGSPGDEWDLGFIAQDVEKVFDGVVCKSATARYPDERTMSYDSMATVSVKCCQEQEVHLETHDEEIAALKAQSAAKDVLIAELQAKDTAKDALLAALSARVAALEQ